MTDIEITPAETDDIAAVATPAQRNPIRDGFDAEIHLPSTISKEFLSAALLWAIENKAEFGVFHDPQQIVFAFLGGHSHYMPSRWSDKRWHIGRENLDPGFSPEDA
ncbi:hypothetical protein [Allorhizobium ampelinum]|uniref:hypothetical protein n=1 Tax=Allorhizobium ampelinum TaxID=3025782 RepID=UPI0002F2FB13|nr:hypothetical protein [Allorhizobium ampelinum]